jgi:hypothetical protein
MKTLLWKEWRESLPALETGAALAVLIRVGSYLEFSNARHSVSYIETSREIFMGLMFFLFFPLFFLIQGADKFSSEKSTGTLPYLISLPVSKTRIWLAKLTAALGSGLTLVIFTVLMNPFIVERCIASPEEARPVPYELCACLLLLLASFNASVILKKPLAAAVAGFAGLVLFIVLGVLIDSLVLRNLIDLLAGIPIARYSSLAVLLIAFLGGLVGTSLFLFLRLGPEGPRCRKAGLVLAVFGSVLFAMTLLQFGLNLRSLSMKESDIAHAGEVATVPGAETVLFTIANRYGCPRICSVSLLGGPVTRLSGRPLSCPSVSPDGRTVVCNPDNPVYAENLLDSRPLNIAYRLFGPSLREYFGLVDYWPCPYGFRIMLFHFPDAKEGLIEPVITKRGASPANFWNVYWNPDGQRFIIYAYPGLLLVTIGKDISVEQVPSGVEGWAFLLPRRWSEDGKKFFFAACQFKKNERSDTLCEFDVESRQTRVIFPSGSRRILSYCDSKKLVYTLEATGSGLFVTGLETGKETPLGEHVAFWYPKQFPRNNPWGFQGCAFLFTEWGEPEELKAFFPDGDSIKTIDRAPDLEPRGISPDGRWGLYNRSEKIRSISETRGLYSVNLATGETHAIAEEGAHSYERIAWAEGPTVVFVKGEKEIWSAAVDGSRSRRLYPEKKQ